jgi:hypothetical protein
LDSLDWVLLAVLNLANAEEKGLVKDPASMTLPHTEQGASRFDLNGIEQ